MSVQSRPRYTLLQRHLHWWMALLVVMAYVLIEQRGLFPRGSGGRTAMMQGHFWAGITVFLLAFWRIVTRVRRGAPPVTPALDGVTALASKLVHVSLYAFFIVMPLLGMATAWSDGKAIMIPFTGVALPALLPENRPLAHTLEDIHGTIGDIFYWVIGLHVLAALYHHWVRRDDTLRRMV